MAQYPDISHWKPVSNWAQVKANCPFMITKATQGTNFIDSYLDTFITNCEKNGIPYWLYTFLNKGNEKAQAQYMVSVCKGKVGKYFRGYILDVEQNNTAEGVKAALDYLKSLGGKCMLYTMYAQYVIYKSVIASRGTNCAWWEARYGANNGKYNSGSPCHAGVDLHQYTSQGSCPGLGSNVDLNRLTGTKDISWFTGESKSTPSQNKDSQIAGGSNIMWYTYQIDGKSTVYWFDGNKVHKLYNPNQLKVVREIYKYNTGTDLAIKQFTKEDDKRLREAIKA